MDTYRRLGDLLTGERLISEVQLASALEQRRDSGERLGAVVVRLGYATEEDIAHALARQFGLAFTKLDSVKPSRSALALLSGAVAWQRLFLPVTIRAGRLHAVVADPFDVALTDSLALRNGVEIELSVAPASTLRVAIGRAYKLPIHATPSKPTTEVDPMVDRAALLKAMRGLEVA